jgi:hypothetical protein
LLDGALADLERLHLRPLLAACRQVLARIDRADGDADGAALHSARAAQLLDEIREEAGTDDPFRRTDLRALRIEIASHSGEAA